MAHDLNTLETRPFGSTGRRVSVLGLGTVKFGRNQDVKYPGGAGFPLPTDAQIEALLDLCLDHGITLIDTAPAYGTSEERLGAVMGARRNKFFLMTKTGEEFENGVSRHDFSAGHTRLSVERSLKRLKTDHLDCVLVHCNRADDKALGESDVLETLAQMKAEGKIGAFGASVYTNAAAQIALAHSDAIMAAYNRDDDGLRGAMKDAQNLGRAVLVKKGLSSGHLNGPADAAEAVRYAAAGPGVTSLLFGSLTPANILSNIRALTGVNNS